MHPNEFEPFALMLRRTFLACSAGQKEPDPGVVELYFDLFSGLSLDEVASCLKAHMLDPERGKFVPRPADITAQVQAMDGHPEPDAAWAIAVKAADEEATIIWTQPIAAAWDSARHLYESNRVSAALAFKGAYSRLLAAERSAGRRAEWLPSLGYDKRLATEALQLGVSSGAIKREALPQEAQLLLEGKPLSLKPPAWMKEKWDALYARLTHKPPPAPTDHEVTLELKAAAKRLVEERQQ
jgi:hypothetical protein